MTIRPATHVKFPLGSQVQHTKGGVYRVVATPDTCVIEQTGEPAYAYIGGDGRIWVRAQSVMEDGRFTLLGKSADLYEDILEMVSSGEGLVARQGAAGLAFLCLTPRVAWDTFIQSLVTARESPTALSRFLNLVQFEATELRTYFCKHRDRPLT